MGRIKVTGYVQEDDLDIDVRDPDHSSGLTEEAHDALLEEFYALEDPDFEYVEDD